MSDSVPSKQISLYRAKDLIGSGSTIDGHRVPLLEFLDAQHAQIERLRDGLVRVKEALGGEYVDCDHIIDRALSGEPESQP